MVNCHWDPNRNEWHLQWKACGQKCNLRVKASALGGDKDAAGEIAAFMKIKIENATSNRDNEAHFNTVRDKKITERMARSAMITQGLGAAHPAQTATTQAAVVYQEATDRPQCAIWLSTGLRRASC